MSLHCKGKEKALASHYTVKVTAGVCISFITSPVSNICTVNVYMDCTKLEVCIESSFNEDEKQNKDLVDIIMYIKPSFPFFFSFSWYDLR